MQRTLAEWLRTFEVARSDDPRDIAEFYMQLIDGPHLSRPGDWQPSPEEIQKALRKKRAGKPR